MADQDGAAHAQRVEQFRQHLVGVLVHVPDGAGERVGSAAAVAVAGVDQGAASGGGGELGGETSPGREAAESAVQKDQGERSGLPSMTTCSTGPLRVVITGTAQSF